MSTGPERGGDADAPAYPGEGGGRVGLLRHLWLLFLLRFQISGNRGRGGGLLGSAIGLLGLLGSGSGVAFAVHAAFAHKAVAAAPLLEMFLFQLLGFLVGVSWVMWPIVAAGVDDSAELSRFTTMPIAPWRLFLASSLSALFEPRALTFYPVLVAAAVGFCQVHGLPFPWGSFLLSTAAFAAFNAAWGRVGLNSMLNVLRHRRSAEILGGGLLVTLFCCALVPPLDVTGIAQMVRDQQLGQNAGQGLALEKLDTRVLEAALIVFSLGPSGVWAPTWLLAYLPSLPHALVGQTILLAYTGGYALMGFAAAFFLLLRFYAHTARSGRSADRTQKAGRAFEQESLLAVLVEREARDLLHNPKARMLAALPFFLTILLKLVRAQEVIGLFTGPQIDVWMPAILTTYGGIVLASNFSQNAFAYDGQGLQLLYAAPVELKWVLRAKNLVHGAASLTLGLVLLTFHALYVRMPNAAEIVCSVCTLSFQVLLILTLGNVLSVISPRKFHAGLQRKDRVPVATTAGGFFAAGVGLIPLSVLLKTIGPGRTPTLGEALLLLPVVLMGVVVYRLAQRPTLELLERDREGLLRAITRE